MGVEVAGEYRGPGLGRDLRRTRARLLARRANDGRWRQSRKSEGVKIAGGNPFEGPRSHEYPLPPHKSTYVTTLFQKACIDLGHHPYPAPTATASQTYRNPDGVTRSGCLYCGYCTRFGCMVGAKSQPTNTLLPLLGEQEELHAEKWLPGAARDP